MCGHGTGLLLRATTVVRYNADAGRVMRAARDEMVCSRSVFGIPAGASFLLH